ncbi:M20 family metallo-hydrolase [Pseudobacillus badius]|uniref:M20 family metallo-hydrolase n=1 Tax=Bacillus badius TaxID=1455 RepID=UPI0024A23155|nr:M20 family metallo-hydrolase [Bacillus badius]GLY10805.1 Zn-dependent hydrolase [Bacillus badius]
MVEKTLSINLCRLMETIQMSGQIGSLDKGGLCRLALTDEDKQMRDLFVKWLKEANLAVRFDDFGNIYGRKEGINPTAAAILIGSHLDTQPEGGRYDGILGVLSSLEVLRTLNEQPIDLERPVEIVCFTNEEGARFEPPIMGAGGLAGVFEKSFIFNCTDKDNKTFGEELERIGYKGSQKNRIDGIFSFIELHIEQGPVLECENVDIGIVTGIQGMNWLEAKVIGQADHAGPTPMSMRQDALAAASKMITEIQQIVTEQDTEATATVGRLSLIPNSINCVPGEVTFSIDIRHSDDRIRKHLHSEVLQRISTIAVIENVQIEVKEIWETDSSHFSEELIECITEQARLLGYSTKKMISGAGHDAKYINKLANTAMIFVPSAGGKSHCQEEFTEETAIEKGANLLLRIVQKLAGGDK